MKILCIVDSYEWALANRARSLQKYFKNHNFVIKHFKETSGVNFNNFDIVYSLNWPIHGYIQSKIGSNRKYRLVTSVSSHIGRKNASTMTGIFKFYDAISTSNLFLYREFQAVYKNKVFYTPFGVESDLFKPITDPSIFSNHFAWVGNSSRPVKRYKVIKSVIDSIPGAKLHTITGGLSRIEMANFYNKVGTVICFSSSEGTPNPILEAASSGRNIISTKVGNVPELIKGSDKIQVVSNDKELRDSIIYCMNNPDIIKINGQFLRKRVESDWSWEIQSKKFKNFLKIN